MQERLVSEFQQLAEMAATLERGRDFKAAAQAWAKAGEHAVKQIDIMWSVNRSEYCEKHSSI